MAHIVRAIGRRPVRKTRTFYNTTAMKPLTYTRAQSLPGILENRIAILDGAMGTMIQRLNSTSRSTGENDSRTSTRT